MTEVNEIYKCNKCGNIVEILEAGTAVVECCGEPMELLEAIQREEGTEKHIPVITVNKDNVKVEVGSTPHPMVDDHWINFIELCVGDQIYRQRLNPGDKPCASFNVIASNQEVSSRIYCNVHGLWPSN
ncbi:MAG: desulfoferrodoxin [Methanobacteriaceae archaeon]|nr:desulfoferrodoxin [Methanobacteriaceae archaeon]